MRKLKIAICGLVKSANLGEHFIAKSLEYLIADALKERGIEVSPEFAEIDILGRSTIKSNANGGFRAKLKRGYYANIGQALSDGLYRAFGKLSGKCRSRAVKNLFYRMRHVIYSSSKSKKKRLMNYFEENMRDVDIIVVDGAGLLEYSFNEYQEPLWILTQYAIKHDIDIIYNAIGCAGAYDESDFRCKILKKALGNEHVKYISARDSVETVRKCAGDREDIKLLADAAFWMDEAYDIKEVTKTKTVGIGLVRGDALTGYGKKFSENNWIDLFADIANELAARGYEYEFFTNGFQTDVVIGEKVIMKLGLPEGKLVKRPETDIELYSSIRGYQGIITCRMHSSIAAFTKYIPAIILSWNEKVEKLMSIIGYPERAIKMESFNAKYIVDSFEKALAEGVSYEKVDKMKRLAKESVDDYIGLIIDSIES